MFPIHSGIASKLFSLRNSISSDGSASRQDGNAFNPLLLRSSFVKYLNWPHKSAVCVMPFQMVIGRLSSVESFSLSNPDISDLSGAALMAYGFLDRAGDEGDFGELRSVLSFSAQLVWESFFFARGQKICPPF